MLRTRLGRATAALLLAALLGTGQAVEQDQTRALEALTRTGCENTASGRWYLTDDRGMVCPRTSFDYSTGCCTAGELHSCATCEAEDKCCAQYEHCVSCCLKPENQPELHMQGVYRGRNKPETGKWDTPFQYCRAVCRTTARSTQHENAFIADRKHCFSRLGRPRVSVPPAPPMPPSIVLVTGGSGQSCDAACSAKQATCREQWFASLNDCNSLRSKFMCEAGCGPSAPDQKEFPGYVEGGAPKQQRPAFCATLAPLHGQAQPKFACGHSAGGVRRLCPCELVPGARQSGQVDGLAGAAGTDVTAGTAQQAQQQQQAAAGAGGAAAQLPDQAQAQAAGAQQR